MSNIRNEDIKIYYQNIWKCCNYDTNNFREFVIGLSEKQINKIMNFNI
jgi:hypothetical protein